MRIQVDPELIPLIRASYTHELAQKLGHLKPDEKLRIEAALKAVDEEEARMARLFASGKITDTVWDNLWAEWQDRRCKLRQSLETVQQEQEFHISNLDTALAIIAKIGVLYNSLERSDQKELLRQVVERVIVNAEGIVKLELRTPFAYLKDLTDEIRSVSRREGIRPQMKIGGDISADPHPECSNWIQLSWGTWTRTTTNESRVRCSAD